MGSEGWLIGRSLSKSNILNKGLLEIKSRYRGGMLTCVGKKKQPFCALGKSKKGC
jgi:hypothetical protein